MPWHKNISPIGMGQAIDHIKAEQAIVKPKASSALYPPAAAPVLLTHPGESGVGPLRSSWAGALPAGKHTAALRAIPYVARLGTLAHPLTAAAATVLSFGLSNRHAAHLNAPLLGAAEGNPRTGWEHAFVPTAEKPSVILEQYFGHNSALPTTTPGRPERLPPSLRNSSPDGFAIDQAGAEPLAGGKPSPIQPTPPQGYAPLTPAWWDSFHLSSIPDDPAYTKWREQVADHDSIAAGQQIHALLDPRRWQRNADKTINRALNQQPPFDPASIDDRLEPSLKDGFLVYEFKPMVRVGDESTTIPLGDDALPGLAHHGLKSALDNKGLLRVLVHQADPQRFPQANARLGNEGRMLRALLHHLASVHATPNALVLRTGELNADTQRSHLVAIKQIEAQLAKSHSPDRARDYAQGALAEQSTAVQEAIDAGFRYDGSTDPEYFDYEFVVVLRKTP